MSEPVSIEIMGSSGRLGEVELFVSPRIAPKGEVLVFGPDHVLCRPGKARGWLLPPAIRPGVYFHDEEDRERTLRMLVRRGVIEREEE